ncbi:GNAT family N-acetyltransferase [Glutamicibacter sp. NPDC087344]|uniref:GNAT family N-acetyltransferase n=1 Tax=Glutamicibacter sp. NPDC087344 TaxID=3363994 RepID=UPI0038077D6E
MPQLIQPVFLPGHLARNAQPVLLNGDLQLRPWLAANATVIEEAFVDPAIVQWHGRTMNATEAHAWVLHWEDRWKNESGAGWAITLHGEIVGQVSLRRIDLSAGSAEISYWILPSARGRGLAAKALLTLTAWAFETIGIHRLELSHSVDNPASCKVAQKCGYLHEGTKRKQALHVDGWHDMHLHARLSSDSM